MNTKSALTSVFAAVAIMMTTISCSPRMFVPDTNQPSDAKVVYSQGIPSLRVTAEQKDVAVDVTRANGTTPWIDLQVFMRNLGDEAYNFEPGDVKVYGYNRDGQMRPLEVYTAERYIRWKNRRDAAIVVVTVAATVAVGVAGAEMASNAPNPIEGDYWWNLATNTAFLASDIARASAAMSAPYISPDRLMRTHTLYADEAIFGSIKVRSIPEYDHRILVEVPVGNGYVSKFSFGNEQRRF
jgi:hypothetical protein